jgi:predicted RNase H-like HicB family nuclease
MQLTYPAIFYEGEGGFAVEVPDLPGCVSGGATLAEAIIMGTDAASGWVLTELEDGRPKPKASSIGDIHPEKGGFVSMLVLDMDAYAEKYGNKAVRKNLTIPAWLNTFAEAKHINFSQVLQDSLTTLYQQETAGKTAGKKSRNRHAT